MQGYIYKLIDERDPDTVLYVGQTRDLWDRQRQYFGRGDGNSRSTKLLSDLRLEDVVHMVIVEHHKKINKADLNAREDHFITTLNPRWNINRNDPEGKRERVRKANNIKRVCECGEIYTRIHLSRHLKSVNHIRKMVGTYIPPDGIQNCPCGAHIKRKVITKHLKTKKHKQYMGDFMRRLSK